MSLPVDLPSELCARVEAAERSLAHSGARLTAVSWPLPVSARPLADHVGVGGADGARRLLDARLTDFDCYWSERRGSALFPDEQTIVGVGCALRYRFQGHTRFAQAQATLEAALGELAIPEDLLPVVRFFGGAAFSAGRDGSGSCWSSFGDASFFLPRVLYVASAGEASLVLLIETGQTGPLLDLASSVLACLGRPLPVPAGTPLSFRTLPSADEAEWTALLRTIQERIEQGKAEKIVAARRITVQLSREPSVADVLGRLDSLAPSCTHFSLRLGSKIFLGATPELLIEKNGLRIATEALAGSIARDHSEAGAELLCSSKDRAEHAFVVQAIAEQLKPWCQELSIPSEPNLRHLRSLLHLCTPIQGTLHRPMSLLSLVERLHPTPAVGGVPRALALEWIKSHEPTERGWYAAPFGFIDGAGNGRFVVALRSALLHRDKVHLYAGAGVVAASDPAREFAETELKLGSMLGALGIAS